MGDKRKQLLAKRKMLLERLNELSKKLKSEPDSLRAESILLEMRSIGDMLILHVNNSVSDHQFLKKQELFKNYAK